MMPRSFSIYNIGLILMICFTGIRPAAAQDPFAISVEANKPQRDLPFDIWMQPNTDSFIEIQRQADDYFQMHGQVRGFKHWKRWEYIMQHRLSPEGKLTNYTAKNLYALRKYEKEHGDMTGRIFGGSWEQEASDDCLPEDPDNAPGIGRVNVIAFHPTSSTTIYAGTPAGGLWKTTNEGVSWEPLSNAIPSLGVSGIAIHPTSPNTIYILTGDGDGGHTPSIGVLKTTNGGATWQETGYIPMDKGYKLVMKPGDPNTLFVAATSGLFRTQDAGGSWTQVLNENMRDIEFRPGTPDTMYASTYEEVFRSYDGGDTWIESTVPGLSLGAARCALAVTPTDPNYVYCIAGPGGPTGFFRGLFRSTNNGLNYQTVSVSPNLLDGSVNGDQPCPGCSQVNWDLAIAVDPNNRDEIIVGAINIWRNNNLEDSAAWQVMTHWSVPIQMANNLEYTHADIHDLVFQDDNRLWCASDGGVYLSTNDGIDWVDKTSAGSDNGLISTQFYRIAGTPQNANLIIGGTQDNGTVRWDGGNDLTIFAGSDGTDCMIDFMHSDTMYFSIYQGQIYKTLDAGVNFTYISPGSSPGAWVTPMRMDPTNHLEIWAGYRDTLYRSLDGGASWTGFIPSPGSQYFQHIYCPPSNGQVVYAATLEKIFRNASNGTGSWTNITGNLPVDTQGEVDSGRITGIVTDVTASGKIWVTLGGYHDGHKVFYSSTGADPWTNVTGTLPNVPVNCIIYDDSETNDNAVYVGTDIGIFYRDAGLNDWVPYRNGLPNVPISDMYVHETGDRLFAGTFGRGLWSSPLYDECPVGWSLTNANQGGIFPEGYRYFQASGYIVSTAEATGGIGSQVFYKAADSIELNVGFRAHNLEVFRAWLGPCAGGTPVIPFAEEIPSGEESLAGGLEEIDPGLEEYMLQESPDEINMTESGNLHVTLSDDQSSLKISTGKETLVDIMILQGNKMVQALESQLLLKTGDNTIPISVGEQQEGRYLLVIQREKERIELPLEITGRKIVD